MTERNGTVHKTQTCEGEEEEEDDDDGNEADSLLLCNILCHPNGLISICLYEILTHKPCTA